DRLRRQWLHSLFARDAGAHVQPEVGLIDASRIVARAARTDPCLLVRRHLLRLRGALLALRSRLSRSFGAGLHGRRLSLLQGPRLLRPLPHSAIIAVLFLRLPSPVVPLLRYATVLFPGLPRLRAPRWSRLRRSALCFRCSAVRLRRSGLRS